MPEIESGSISIKLGHEMLFLIVAINPKSRKQPKIFTHVIDPVQAIFLLPATTRTDQRRKRWVLKCPTLTITF